MARVNTTGITETTFEINGTLARLFDVGGTRSERKKWIHAFEKVDIVVFHVDIAAYDQLLFEDESVNRLQEDLVLFDSILSSRWFIKTSFILSFTKLDKLEKKVKKSLLKDYCPDFDKDGRSVEDVKAYIESRFLSLNQRPEKKIEVVYTSFIDGDLVDARRIFDSMIRLFPVT